MRQVGSGKLAGMGSPGFCLNVKAFDTCSRETALISDFTALWAIRIELHPTATRARFGSSLSDGFGLVHVCLPYRMRIREGGNMPMAPWW